ncbi:hypothetical protein PAXRUDRAFT_832985 [Paxillus rubicundulus Ve08.2h10]|uniref:Uncharacterized protein n=1 Tax=Paxillus rubicundulus Ve08.2h10 TaxID=930991 RepID=A0A0D0DQ15_9AGAM|nr:hypothetical protein PAXRUDRAFT_832985 [Paxillus rubicundulus Ve08.2h10]
MSPGTIESGTHLTTSRINRLLRPLRNKCISLATLSNSAATAVSRATHSKQLSNRDADGVPSLTGGLHTSAGPIGKRLILDRSPADDFELSRRIQAVCDAFRNIAHVAYGIPCTERIPSLAAMCSLVIGKNIPIAISDGSKINFGDVGTHEDDVMEVVGSIYDSIPPHYRRFSIVSHALSVILCVCTPHYALVNILLDHCLSFGLVHESTRLLSIILSQALLPSNPSFEPPITHPAHTTYLVDLHTKWVTASKQACTPCGTQLFTTSAFCRVTNAILLQSVRPNCHILWTSKVLDRLVRMVESCDVDSFISIIQALVQNFWNISGSSPDASPQERGNAHVLLLRDRLFEWVSSLFDMLFFQNDPTLRSSQNTLPNVCAIIDVLDDCRAAQLHSSRVLPAGSQFDLPNIITALTTHIYVISETSLHNADRLLAVLDGASPVPATFNKLMTYLCRLQIAQTFESFSGSFLSEVQVYSSALRSQKLLGLDASLWACALHHFETFIASSQTGNTALVSKYKRQLMDIVDAVERKCFGGGTLDSSPSVPVSARSQRAKRMHRRRPSGHWEWEEMVGCWIRKTPVHKKRRADEESPLNRLSSPRPLSHTFSHSPSSRSSESDSYTEDGSEYQEDRDKENHPGGRLSVHERSQPLRRRQSNFSSLLADAQVNRIVLHSKPQPKSRLPASVMPKKYILPSSLQQQRQVPRKKGKDSSRYLSPTPTVPPLVKSGIMLPSDDSLDLFAYATSSPERC